tara:strand:- start:9236 stop:10495 length:1260 start_codon:yes stop_codon:yes gene_type:complete
MRVAHFNHGLRSKESDEDKRFVEDMTLELQLKFSQKQWKRKSQDRVSMENARRARFEFLRKTQNECNSRILFLGHQLNDVVEMMLMRMARGSCTGGLAAPRPVHQFRDGIFHLRPLLELSHSEIVVALTKAGVEWREDSSNRSGKYTRNRIRNEVVPLLRGASPQDAIKGAGRTRELLEEDDEALNWWLNSMVGGVREGRIFDLSPLRCKPRALIRRAVESFLWTNEVRPILGRHQVEKLIQAAIEGDLLRLEVGKEVVVLTKKCQLVIEERKRKPELKWTKLRVRVPAVVYLPCGASLSVSVGSLGESKRTEVREGNFDEQKEVFLHLEKAETPDLVVRRWEPGDRYRPLGAPGRIKLQDLFTNRKIARTERNLLPIVSLNDDEIIWCPGIPPSNAYKIRPDSRFALRLTYCRSLNRL